MCSAYHTAVVLTLISIESINSSALITTLILFEYFLQHKHSCVFYGNNLLFIHYSYCFLLRYQKHFYWVYTAKFICKQSAQPGIRSFTLYSRQSNNALQPEWHSATYILQCEERLEEAPKLTIHYMHVALNSCLCSRCQDFISNAGLVIIFRHAILLTLSPLKCVP